MKKYEILVDDSKAGELADLLRNLPYVKDVKETTTIDSYTLVSEQSLGEDWLLEEDDEFQKLYSK